MRFHWQNLSDAPGRERHGFWHGRAWLRFDDGSGRAPELKFEWSHGRIKAACEIDLRESKREVQLHIALPGFSWFLGVEGLPRRLFELLPFRANRDRYGGDSRTIGWTIHDDAIWISLWRDDMESRATDPKWWHTVIHYKDLIFGKSKYATREIERRDVTIPMLEKSYPAVAIRKASEWIRPRWPWAPFSTRRISVEIDVPGGIGVPGKGENDWDIGPDAIYSISTPSETIEGAIGHLVARVLQTRKRYGGSHEAVS